MGGFTPNSDASNLAFLPKTGRENISMIPATLLAPMVPGAALAFRGTAHAGNLVVDGSFENAKIGPYVKGRRL
jgi:hypothetical protein